MSLGGALLDAGQPARQPGARLDLDIGGQPLQHVVEQRDLPAGIAARAGHEQVGDALQDAQAFLHVACFDVTDEFVDDRLADRQTARTWGEDIGIGHGAQ